MHNESRRTSAYIKERNKRLTRERNNTKRNELYRQSVQKKLINSKNRLDRLSREKSQKASLRRSITNTKLNERLRILIIHRKNNAQKRQENTAKKRQ
jgi:hypothetical protein